MICTSLYCWVSETELYLLPANLILDLFFWPYGQNLFVFSSAGVKATSRAQGGRHLRERGASFRRSHDGCLVGWSLLRLHPAGATAEPGSGAEAARVAGGALVAQEEREMQAVDYGDWMDDGDWKKKKSKCFITYCFTHNFYWFFSWVCKGRLTLKHPFFVAS